VILCIGTIVLWELCLKKLWIVSKERFINPLWLKLKKKVSTWMGIVVKKFWHDPTTKLLIKLEEWLK
jgi:hypothetical protein